MSHYTTSNYATYTPTAPLTINASGSGSYMGSGYSPAHLNVAHFQHPAGAQTGPATPTMMVHTPYSCAHDLVPTGCEAASHLGSSWPEEGMTHHGSNGSFGPMDNIGSVTKRRSYGSSNTTSPPPESTNSGSHNATVSSANNSQTTFDPWGSLPSTVSPIPQPQQHLAANTSGGFEQQRSSGDASVNSAAAASSNNYPNFMMRAPIMNAPIHSTHLGGKCEYLEVPESGAEISTAAQWNRQFKVFIGHVKFEVSADGLRWLVYMLTGVQAGKIEVRGMGCFMVFFSSAEEVFKVRGLHKRVLFDTNGIWFAQNADQEALLHRYANTVAPTLHAKLPKGLLVVDEETSRRRKNKKSSNSKNQNQMMQHTNSSNGMSASSSFMQQAGPHHQTRMAPPQQQQVQAPTGGFKSHASAHLGAAELWAEQQQHQQQGVVSCDDYMLDDSEFCS